MNKQPWTREQVEAWFVGRAPDAWFADPPKVTIDRDEILVVGTIAEPGGASDPSPSSEGEEDPVAGDTRQVARLSRVDAFREDTREKRIAIAREAETLWGRKVSWGVRCGSDEVLFSTASVPVMTRLRLGERAVLDTLIDAGVARSRSDALAWCVRLVNRHQEEWIEQLRSAVSGVAEARAGGPDIT
ncbi:MAG: hypothetical protein M3Z46_02335 [Actinomycetota bacterium]|nr:hypothetical protein [Actinomycetota bacterium]